MHHRLLFAASLALASHAGYAQSYLLVGQTAGTAAVTLNPVVSLSGQGTYSPGSGGGDIGQQQLLDVDNDGIDDLVISASGSAAKYPWHTADTKALHADVEFYSNPPASPGGYSCISLASGDTLQPVMHRRNAAGTLGSWSSASSINLLYGTIIYNSLAFSVVANGAFGQMLQGDWLDLQAHYAGFRLRANPNAPWRYGWLRVQVSHAANPVTLNIQAYALAAVPLSALSAHAAGWQIYPTSVDDRLTLAPPTAGERGQLTVLDLCGRPVLRTTLSGSPQQLDLSALATGLYSLRLETPAGSFTQRISKR